MKCYPYVLNRLLLPVLLSGLLATGTGYAQDAKKKKDKDKKETSDKSDSKSDDKDKKTIASVVKKSKKYDGLFTVYQDTTNGEVHLLVKKDQLGKEYIYFSHITDGTVEAYSFRGAFMDNKVFTLRKYFNKIDLVTENTNFYFDPKSPLSKAAAANVSNSVMASQKIVAEDTVKNEYLIKVDEVFLSESLQEIKPVPDPKAKPGDNFSLGTLSKDKTKYARLKNYPLNTDITVEYVYDNPLPYERGGPDIVDARSVSIQLQHSFIEMPKNNFQSRMDDPRIGYFTTETDDQTTVKPINYRDLIHRWHLEKKDKGAAVSEPVEPIVFWIENTTPTELRETIRKAGLTWNEAFEKAGFRDAIQIKEQPDNADWDAGDLRYNVLRWTSSPNPPFGGYGPSFVNPRTGQIIGADIMLEYVYMVNRELAAQLYESQPAQEAVAARNPANFCTLGHHLHQRMQFGQTALHVMDSREEARKEFMESALYYLVIHEMGHTLGLNHNMKSSQLYSPADIQNKALTMKTGLVGSVMDYPDANIAPLNSQQGQYFTTKPGPYDVWAIEYGYSEAATDVTQEKQRLAKLLARSTEPQLTFGNDADDMRSPGNGIDPRVMINDLSSDAVTYAVERTKLTTELLKRVKTKYSGKPDQSYQELRSAYNYLVRDFGKSATVISRYIGGVYVDRSFIGQPTTAKPLTPVVYKDQKRAMQALNKYMFSPEAVKVPNDLYNYLQQQRRGFHFFRNPEDPKIHDQMLAMHKSTLDQLLHPKVMNRIVDSELYGNAYKLPEMMADLTNAVFKADLSSPVNSFRQNLQQEYVKRLIDVAGLESKSTHGYPAQAQALYHLKAIRKMVVANPGADQSTRAHRELLAFRIDNAMEKK